MDSEASERLVVAQPTGPADKPRRSPVLLLLVGALAGGMVGFVVGQYIGAERVRDQLSHPLTVAPAEPAVATNAAGAPSAGPSADPSPPAGAKILSALPLQPARAALAKLVEKDPVVVEVGAVGRGDEGLELHLSLKNRGACKVKAVSGVAYGFDPEGGSTATNAGGLHYVAFHIGDLALAPGETTVATQPLHFAEVANVAIGQVDRAECDDGKTLTRP